MFVLNGNLSKSLVLQFIDRHFHSGNVSKHTFKYPVRDDHSDLRGRDWSTVSGYFKGKDMKKYIKTLIDNKVSSGRKHYSFEPEVAIWSRNTHLVQKYPFGPEIPMKTETTNLEPKSSY